MNKKKWLKFLLAIAFIGTVFVLFQNFLRSKKEVLLMPAQKTAGEVVAEAKVVPVKTSALSLPIGGVISEILVSEGDSVQEGALLLRLSFSNQARAALLQAQAEVRRMQAQIGDLKETAESDLIIAKKKMEEVTSALSLAKNELARMEQLFAVGITTQQALDRVRDQMQTKKALLEVHQTEQQMAIAHQKAARALYDRMTKGLRLSPLPNTNHSENIAVAAADLEAAQAALKRAEITLEETELRAPFAGMIGHIDLRVGEYVAPGTTLVNLADLSEWQIETTDLTELSVVKVKEGDRAKIGLDAVPDFHLYGTVSRIQPMGENKHGDILYTVWIKPDRNDARFFWNMTATITIP